MAGSFISKWGERLSGTWDKSKKWGSTTFDRMPKPLQNAYTLLVNSVKLFSAHDTAALGSGLSYYTVFSIAPMLIIVISISGSILGPEAVTGALKHQLEGLFGSNTAEQLQSMVKAAYKPGKNWIATAISIMLLIAGAIGVFDQLRSSLNIIWDVKPAAKKPFWAYLVNRLFSFGMIGCIAFLLLVSLVITAGIAALSQYFNGLIPAISKLLIGLAEIVVSLGITTLLFAFIYRFMSDIRMKWGNVFYGAIFTSVFFAIGKYMIGIYISQSDLANTYGAASSVIVILLWVFYSSQIVFFGAEFTRALADMRGIHIKGIKENDVAPPASAIK